MDPNGERGVSALQGPDAAETNDPADGLTADERVTLRLALDMGYFEEPRATALVEAEDERTGSDVDVSREMLREVRDRLHQSDDLGARES